MTKRPAPPALIRTRPRAGVLMGLGLSLAFAAIMAPIATIDVWLLASTEIAYGEPAPFTVRVPHFGGLRAGDDTPVVNAGSVVVARGEPVARAHQARVLAGVTQDERVALYTALKKLHAMCGGSAAEPSDAGPFPE